MWPIYSGCTLDFALSVLFDESTKRQGGILGEKVGVDVIDSQEESILECFAQKCYMLMSELFVIINDQSMSAVSCPVKLGRRSSRGLGQSLAT